MAQNFEIPPGSVKYDNRLRDSRGVTVLRPNYEEVVTVLPDGESKVYKLSEYVELSDGRLLTAVMLSYGKIELAICDHCRYPLPPPWWWLGWRRWWTPERPSVGVFARDSGACCAGCSRFVCRKHSRVVTDGSLRCIPCARRFRWRAFFHALFYAPVHGDH
jgi:hypothetical protein